MIKKLKFGVKKLSDAIALLSAELLLVFIAFFISLGLLIILIREVIIQKQENFDHNVFEYLKSYVSDTNTGLMQLFSFFGSHYFLVPAWLLVLAIYFFWHKNKWVTIKLATVGLSNLLLMFGLKFFFDRPRPLIPLLKHVPGLSFPSGHAFMSFTFFCTLIYIVYINVATKWLKWTTIGLLVVMIILVGFSRIYLRVHYFSDVIAGYCFGVLSLVILFWLLRQVERYNAKKIPAVLKVIKPEDPPAVKTGH